MLELLKVNNWVYPKLNTNLGYRKATCSNLVSNSDHRTVLVLGDELGFLSNGKPEHSNLATSTSHERHRLDRVYWRRACDWWYDFDVRILSNDFLSNVVDSPCVFGFLNRSSWFALAIFLRIAESLDVNAIEYEVWYADFTELAIFSSSRGLISQ